MVAMVVEAVESRLWDDLVEEQALRYQKMWVLERVSTRVPQAVRQTGRGTTAVAAALGDLMVAEAVRVSEQNLAVVN